MIFLLILVIVAVVIFAELSTSASTQVSAVQNINYSTATTRQNFTLTPVGIELVTSTFFMTNGTDNLSSSNFSVDTSGNLGVFANFNASDFNATWEYKPVGFIDDATSRLVVTFIVVFASLAALFFATKFVS